MKSSLKAHLFVLTANVIYGANYSIAKGIMPSLIGPFGFIFIRVIVAAILFALINPLFTKEKIASEDRLRLILCAIFGVAMNQLLFFKGLSLTTPINSGLMMVTNPIFVMLLSALFLSETITTRHTVGILAGLSGAVILILYRGNANGHVVNSTPGDVCVLMNSLSYAGYIVLIKPLMHKYHPLTIMQFIFGLGALMVIPFGWTEFSAVQWSLFGYSEWAALIFVVFGTTFLAYLLNTLALKELSAGVVSVYIYLQPLLAAGFAMLLGKDQPAWIHLFSATLIFTGVYLTTSRIRKPVDA